MALSYTYIQLQHQIASELGDKTNLIPGSGIWSPIKNAIQSAIAKWEPEPFYFNEVYDSPLNLFTTVDGQERYTVADSTEISNAAYIDQLRIVVGTNRFVLTKRSWRELEDLSVDPAAEGQPTEWASYGKQIRLYPIPNAAYPIRGGRIKKLTALSADADANCWTQDGYDLIRLEAKLHLARNVLRDPQLAAECEAQIYGPWGCLRMLKAETTRRAKSQIRPIPF